MNETTEGTVAEVETPVEAVVEAPVKEKKPKVKKPSKPKAVKAASKPKKEKVAAKPKSAKKVAAVKGDKIKLGYSAMMQTRLKNGSLRNPHIAVLRALDRADGSILAVKVSKAAKIGMRHTSAALLFVVNEGFVKVEDREEGTCYKISADGKKEVTKADKAAAKKE